jgi:hypothetical protein
MSGVTFRASRSAGARVPSRRYGAAGLTAWQPAAMRRSVNMSLVSRPHSGGNRRPLSGGLTVVRSVVLVVLCLVAASCSSSQRARNPRTGSPTSVPAAVFRATTTVGPCTTTPTVPAGQVTTVIVPPGQSVVQLQRGEVLEVILAEPEAYLSAPAGQPLPAVGFPWQPVANTNPRVLTSTPFPGDCPAGGVSSLPMARYAFRVLAAGQTVLQAALSSSCLASPKCRTLPPLNLEVTVSGG